MKKKIIAVLLSMCLVLSMTACGGADDTKDATAEEETVTETEEETAEETVEEEPAKEETAEEEPVEEADSENTTLEEYMATQDVQSMIDSTQASVGDTMIVDMYAEGNDLIYSYEFVEDSFDESTMELMSEELVKQLKKQTSVFADVAAEMNSQINADDCRVIVRYTYKDEVIAEAVFEEGDEAPEEEAIDKSDAAAGTLEEYFGTADGQAMVDAAQGSASADESMNIEIFAEGNDLVYTYTYEDGAIDSSMIDSVSEQLVSAMETQSSTFETIASQMNDLIGADDCRVIVRYYYGEELLAEGIFEPAE